MLSVKCPNMSEKETSIKKSQAIMPAVKVATTVILFEPIIVLLNARNLKFKSRPANL